MNTVIFQFYHDKSNTLTLHAWPQRNRYHPKATIFLHPTKTAYSSIHNKDVHLGNLNITQKEYRELLRAISGAGNDYFYFYPKVQLNNTENLNEYYIIYDVYQSSKLPSSKDLV